MVRQRLDDARQRRAQQQLQAESQLRVPGLKVLAAGTQPAYYHPDQLPPMGFGPPPNWGQMYAPLGGMQGYAPGPDLEARQARARNQMAGQDREFDRRREELQQRLEEQGREPQTQAERNIAQYQQQMQTQEDDFQRKHGMTTAQAFNERLERLTRENEEHLPQILARAEQQLQAQPDNSQRRHGTTPAQALDERLTRLTRENAEQAEQ